MVSMWAQIELCLKKLKIRQVFVQRGELSDYFFQIMVGQTDGHTLPTLMSPPDFVGMGMNRRTCDQPAMKYTLAFI